MSNTELPRGGAWLIEDADAAGVFTREQLSDEHRLIARTTDEFVDGEVLPQLATLEAKDWALSRRLMRRAGDLGLLGLDVPEEYGGIDLDRASSLVVAEQIWRAASFAVTFGGQTNLCILPISLFGTEAQKARYLPRLVAGDLIGAYALSEAGSGSDALAARTRATARADGSWVLDGEKMWISNGGFADLIIVFAKADGDRFTAFLVERAFPGVSSGHEEHKMGLHGSSTTPLVLRDVPVPAENVLGEVGRGHKVALNTLNYGRFKLGAMCVGGCRVAIGDAARYAAERRQFNQPIATFGAIRHKLGEMVSRTYAVESLLYRTCGLLEAALAGVTPGTDGAGMPRPTGAALAAAFEEFAIEASIAKVAGSETLDFVLDENVQIHGGNGFVNDYPAERYFRDARVNRIFEGTNEINRLLISGMLARRAAKGDLPLFAAARRLHEELLSSPQPATGAGEEDALSADLRTVGGFKKLALMVLGTAAQTYGDQLTHEQEVLGYAADILIDTYAAESAVLRAQQVRATTDRVRTAGAEADVHEMAARVFVHDAAQRVDAATKSALGAMADGDSLRTLSAAARRFLKPAPLNTVALRRQLAEQVTRRGRYILGS